MLNKDNVDDGKIQDKDEVVSTIQNDKILASSIFNKPEDIYYVFAYNADEENDKAAKYSALFEEYDAFEDEEKVVMFWVDLSDPLNKDVVAEKVEDENKAPSEYENLSIYSPALIRIKDGKLDKYYDGDYAIDKLERLVKSHREKAEEDK